MTISVEQIPVFVPLLSTAGSVMVAILLQAVLSMWQDPSKDVESMGFYLFIAIMIFLMVEPLVLGPMRLLESPTQEVFSDVLLKWMRQIPRVFAMLVFTPVFRLVREHQAILSIFALIRSGATKAPFEESMKALKSERRFFDARLVAQILSLALYVGSVLWLTHYMVLKVYPGA